MIQEEADYLGLHLIFIVMLLWNYLDGYDIVG